MKVTAIIILMLLSAARGAEIVYPGKFTVTLTKDSFTYKDSYFTERVAVQKCNEDVLKSAVALFSEKDKKTLVPRLPASRKILFKRDNKTIEVSRGSKVHLNLDAFTKTVHGYISRARARCVKS